MYMMFLWTTVYNVSVMHRFQRLIVTKRYGKLIAHGSDRWRNGNSAAKIKKRDIPCQYVEELVDRLDRVSHEYSLLVNVDTTKLMASDGIACRILIQNEQLVQVAGANPGICLRGPDPLLSTSFLSPFPFPSSLSILPSFSP